MGFNAPDGVAARIKPHEADPIAPPLYAPVHDAGVGAGVSDVNCDWAFVMPDAFWSQSGVHQPFVADPFPESTATQFAALAGQPLAPDPALKSHF